MSLYFCKPIATWKVLEKLSTLSRKFNHGWNNSLNYLLCSKTSISRVKYCVYSWAATHKALLNVQKKKYLPVGDCLIHGENFAKHHDASLSNYSPPQVALQLRASTCLSMQSTCLPQCFVLRWFIRGTNWQSGRRIRNSTIWSIA